jgi:hypothetical protein
MIMGIELFQVLFKKFQYRYIFFYIDFGKFFAICDNELKLNYNENKI